MDPIVQAMLCNLAERPKSDVLGELAGEVLAGRMTLGAASQSAAYEEFLNKTVDDGMCGLGTLSEEERKQYIEQGTAFGKTVDDLDANGAPARTAEELAERAKCDPRVAEALDGLANVGVPTESTSQPEAAPVEPPDDDFDESFEDHGWLVDVTSSDGQPGKPASETRETSTHHSLPPRSLRRSHN